MKSFDEVMEALSICGRHLDCKGCPYENVSYPTEIANTCKDIMHYDALYYMKEYERISAKLEKIALGNITETLEKLDNPALTWEELRGMERKPVWFESENYYEEYQIGEKDCPIKYDKEECWVIIDKVMAGTVKFKQINGRILKGWRRVKGKAWEAYRKERS